MGWKYEVEAYLATNNKPYPHTTYKYITVYKGNSRFKALLEAFRARRAGAGCIRVHWR